MINNDKHPLKNGKSIFSGFRSSLKQFGVESIEDIPSQPSLGMAGLSIKDLKLNAANLPTLMCSEGSPVPPQRNRSPTGV